MAVRGYPVSASQADCWQLGSDARAIGFKQNCWETSGTMQSSTAIPLMMPNMPTGLPSPAALAQPANAPLSSSRQVNEAKDLALAYVGSRDDQGHERRCAALLAALAWTYRQFSQTGGADMEGVHRNLTQHLARSCREGNDAETLADALADLHLEKVCGDESRYLSPVHVQLAHDVLAAFDIRVDAHKLLSKLIENLPESHGGNDNGVDELYRSALCAWVAIEPPESGGKRVRGIARDRILNMVDGKLNLSRLGLGRLPELPAGLAALDARDNQLTELPALPAGLTQLWAYDNRLSELPKLPASLTSLNVHDNQLTQLPELPASLAHLWVYDNQLTELPELPANLALLNVSGNRLTDLPASVLRMPRNAMVITFDNPFSAGFLRRLDAATSAPGYNGPQFHFSMATAGVSTATLRPLPVAVRDWFSNNEQAQAHQWQKHSEEAHAAEFSLFLDRLRESVNYNAGFKTAVAHWLSTLARDGELRQLAFRVVQGATESCEDRVALTYNDLTKLSHAHAITRGEYDARLDEIVDRGRGAFRLDALEKIARKKAQALPLVDEIEVYLAYQVQLRDRLKLPNDIADMRFFHVSGVTPRDLWDAEQEVRARESTEFPRYFLAEWAPWQQVLARLDPDGTERAHQKLHDMLPGYDQAVVTRLTKLNLPRDQDTQSQVGVSIMKAQQFEVYKALTREFLRKRGEEALMDRIMGTDNRWQLQLRHRSEPALGTTAP
ncbi:E3 ubiquitin-protein ligase ipaH3 [Pandoraea pulmonicola]|uniref:E3 ubiquitin-protein ligase ipaH3 n=3 Tax=Pandoraea pulmonicola TaxID=93221 RepID=A0AAJ4ZAR5_PANPU|nr:E3 ubiquitin-protein ligase ipaH3 [Pandoraea pulmonicola]